MSRRFGSVSPQTRLGLGLSFMVLCTVILNGICDTPAEILASRDPGDVYFDAAWQIVVGKGADLWNQLEY